MKKFLNNIEDNICAIILLAMTILTCVNVFARYVFLSSMPFVEELTPMGLVVLSIAGAAVAAKKGAHLGLTRNYGFAFTKISKTVRTVCSRIRFYFRHHHFVLRIRYRSCRVFT